MKRYKSKQNSYIYADTPCGRIKGVRKNGCHIFKGVRYAAAGRWEDPQVVTQWQGEYDATKPGPWCFQHDAFFEQDRSSFSKFYADQIAEKTVVEYSEDCLNLNIWTPEGAENAPVAVFVHGGSFVSGGNGQAYAVGEEYCKRGVILVSINYRLNAFASVHVPGHGGNYGLKDQIAAFTWLRDNIAAFGGDPTRIVAIGESAGALSLQCLLYAPAAKGLLSGVIMMSGGGNLDGLGIPTRPEYAQATWSIVKEQFGVKTLDELKDKPAKEIYSAWVAATLTDVGLANNSAKPIIDGEIIPESAARLIAQGKVHDIPCIIGVLSEDMFPYILYTKAMEWGAIQSQAGRSPVYGYYMDRQLPGGDDVGCYHGCDLWYCFGALDLNWRPFTEIDYRIAENMVDYFTTFVKTGNPNGQGLAEWTPLTAEDPRFLHFGDEEPEMCQPPAEKLQLAIQNSFKPFPGMG